MINRSTHALPPLELSPADMDRFWRSVSRGAANACWPGPHKFFYGFPTRRSRAGSVVAWRLEHGGWPAHRLSPCPHEEQCCNPAHTAPYEPVARLSRATIGLPLDEVARWFGLPEPALRRLCRRLLRTEILGPRDLDRLAEALSAVGG